MTGRRQRSGRTYHRATGYSIPAYRVEDARGNDIGMVVKRATGWIAYWPDGQVALEHYGGSRDAAAAYLDVRIR